MGLKITSNQSGFGDYVQYRTIINDAAGIFPKTPIKVAGINAGRIKDIQLTGNQALVSFEILSDVKITKFSILRVKSVGMLGDKYLDIFLGEDSAPRLTENSLIPAQSGGGLDDLAKDASEVMSDLKAVVKGLRESFSPEGKETPLVEIVENIREFSDNTKVITRTLRRMINTNEDKINDLVANMSKLTDSLAFHTDPNEKGGFMADLKKIGSVMDDAKTTIGDIKTIVGDVKAGKGTVGKLLRDEEVIDNVNETLSGVGKMFNRFNQVQTDLSLFSNYNTGNNSRNEVTLNLYTAPERFFRMGLVTSEFGPKNEKQVISTINGKTTVEERNEQEKNTFKFNFQFGRGVHSWIFRAGVIESSGGLGIDYLLSRLNTKLTFEALDFRESKGPNLRILSEVHLWNVVYGKVGFEDILPERNNQGLTMAAGLKFTDDDIKSLLAFFLR